MQKPKVEELMAISHNAESSLSPQCSDSIETCEKAWNKEKKGQHN